MTPRIATWRTLSKLRQRRIDALGKEREGALDILRQRQEAHREAHEAQQAANGHCEAHEDATQEMLARKEGFAVGEYLDRQNFAPILKERLAQASAKAKTAADAERAQEQALDALRAQINRQTARLDWLKAQLKEEIRLRDEMLQELEDEEIAETATARRLMESTA